MVRKYKWSQQLEQCQSIEDVVKTHSQTIRRRTSFVPRANVQRSNRALVCYNKNDSSSIYIIVNTTKMMIIDSHTYIMFYTIDIGKIRKKTKTKTKFVLITATIIIIIIIIMVVDDFTLLKNIWHCCVEHNQWSESSSLAVHLKEVTQQQQSCEK